MAAKATIQCLREVETLLSAFGVLVKSALVQYQLRGLPPSVRDKGDLSINHFEEKIALAFGKDFKLWLAGGLYKKVIALTCDCQRKSRRQRIFACVSIKELRIYIDLFVLSRRFCQRKRRIQQMMANIIHAGIGARIGERHHSDARLGIKANEGPITPGSTVVPDDLFAIAGENMPTQCNLNAASARRAARLQHCCHRRSKRGLCIAKVRGEKGKQVVGGGTESAGSGQRWEVPVFNRFKSGVVTDGQPCLHFRREGDFS